MKNILLLLIVILLAGLGVGGYLVFSKNRVIIQPVSSPSLSPSPLLTATPVPMPTQSEEETLKTIIKQALIAKHGATANELTVTVSKIEGNYAQGGAAEQGGGGMWFAAKVGGVWKLVWDGNGTISCSDIAPYDFPKSMIPECWDTTTGKSVKR